MENLYLAVVLLPLSGAVIVGLFGRFIGRKGSHRVTILCVAISTILSMMAYKHHVFDGGQVYNQAIYTWLVSDSISFETGFLIDSLSVTMMVIVSFVSWMVHIYTIGYMKDDPGYQRFFSYISLFTFAMLMLVMSNNFLQLFFGWEAVGLVSYLLIGFWYKKETANFASLKAFLVNRVGDFGFLLGIAAILMYFNTLDYAEVFAQSKWFADTSIVIWGDEDWSLMTVICICLFIGAMGKSAQMPLHVWLPDSMEGPTPISALIHAATMVTAGIFMVARMSPLFELSETALSFMLFVGAITALSMGFIGLVQNDIKRVVAYSTLSQLGYMTVALGASAYAAAIFHLVTHAFFKALLFLGAGAVIIMMRHEQDMRRMGGLSRYMPLTWLTCLCGTLALVGFPGTSGFFSKDAIIEAVHASHIAGSDFAWYAVLAGVFFTALYSFRLLFMTFHGERYRDEKTPKHVNEAPLVMLVPLLALAVPSLIAGMFLAEPMLYGDYFKGVIHVSREHDVLAETGRHYHGAGRFIVESFLHAPVWLGFAGFFMAWLCYIKKPELPGMIAIRLSVIYRVLENKYGFDTFNRVFFINGARNIGRLLWRYGDIRLIDGFLVNGLAAGIHRFSVWLREIQTGYLYHYAFVLIVGLLILLVVFVYGLPG